MTAWERINDAALTYVCNRCGAQPGQWCIARPSKRRSTYLHDVRTKAIRQLVFASWNEGKDEVLDAFDQPTRWFSTMLDRRRKERSEA